MRDEQELLLQAEQEVADESGVREVEQGGGLVGHHDRRVGREHAGEGEQLPLAAGQGVHAAVGEVLQPEPRSTSTAAARRSSLFLWVRRSDRATSSAAVGMTSWAAGSVKTKRDASPHLGAVLGDVEAVDDDGALARLGQPVHQPGQGRLARAVRADEGDAVLGEVERGRLEDDDVALARAGADDDVVQLDAAHGPLLAAALLAAPRQQVGEGAVDGGRRRTP